MPDAAPRPERLRAPGVPLSAPTAPRAGLRAGISSEGGPGPALASVEVFQTDDRYASPVLRGRYQVLASAIGTSFYVYDLHRADQIRTEAKDIRRFEKKSDAFAYLGFTIDEMKTMSLISAQDVEDTEKEIEMAKARVVTEAMAKAQASMEARIAAKRAKAAPVKAEKAEAPKVAKVAAPKAEKVKAAPTNGVAKGRGQAAMFRELIAANKMTDKEMLAEVRAAFPDKKVVESSVTFYRARM